VKRETFKQKAYLSGGKQDFVRIMRLVALFNVILYMLAYKLDILDVGTDNVDPPVNNVFFIRS
jgi:hypothetical protein